MFFCCPSTSDLLKGSRQRSYNISRNHLYKNSGTVDLSSSVRQRIMKRILYCYVGPSVLLHTYRQPVRKAAVQDATIPITIRAQLYRPVKNAIRPSVGLTVFASKSFLLQLVFDSPIVRLIVISAALIMLSFCTGKPTAKKKNRFTYSLRIYDRRTEQFILLRTYSLRCL